MSFKHLKRRCAGCERSGVQMGEEHLYPSWLIKRTGTHQTGIRWLNGIRISALSATLPLCTECNHDFGKHLEERLSKIFDDLEAKRGISDNEAELLVRWLWKIAGLFWIALNPKGDYTLAYTLRERVLSPIDMMRGKLVLAISLIGEIDPSFGDEPLGIDSYTQLDAIFVSGVFSKIAIMVVHENFADMIPEAFSQYRLCVTREAWSDGKFFHPKVGFKDDTEAVTATWLVSQRLSLAHDTLQYVLRTVPG